MLCCCCFFIMRTVAHTRFFYWPGKPGLAPNLSNVSILSRHAKTFYILLDTIQASLPGASGSLVLHVYQIIFIYFYLTLYSSWPGLTAKSNNFLRVFTSSFYNALFFVVIKILSQHGKYFETFYAHLTLAVSAKLSPSSAFKSSSSSSSRVVVVVATAATVDITRLLIF